MTRSQTALVGAVVTALVLTLQGGRPPYDDAFFFVRFAHNTVEHGVPAWNVSDGPIYGNTSQLHQGMATALRLIASDHVLALLRVLSAAWLTLAAWALARAPEQRGAALVALLGPIGLATLTTGMETAMVVGLGALFVSEWQRPEGERDGVLGVVGIALVMARPDMALLVGVSLLARVQTRGRLEAIALWGLGTAMWLMVCAAIYGSPVPTAFLTKAGATTLYDDTFLQLCRAAKLRHVALFALCVAPLVARWQRAHWPLAAAAIAFVSYHLLGNLDVMGMHARYYAPALPWIVAAGAGGGWPRLPAIALWGVLGVAAVGLGVVPGTQGWSLGQVSPFAYAALFAAIVALSRERAAWAAVALLAGVVAAPNPGSPWRTDDTLARDLAAQVTTFRGVETIAACLPPDVHVFHSEIGVPGQLLRQATITDLGGLMGPVIPADQLDAYCIAQSPDAVFLPHRNYREAHKALAKGSCLRGYDRVVERSASPLFIRRDRMERWSACGR